MTDYIVIHPHVIPTLDGDARTVYSWNLTRHATQQDAIDWGRRILDHDDFNIGRVEGNQLVWFGWMDEQHDLSAEELAEIGGQLGLGLFGPGPALIEVTYTRFVCPACHENNDDE